MKKICIKCGIEKAFGEFYNRKDAKDGKTSHCKICMNLKGKEYYKLNVDKEKERGKKYRNLNEDKIKKQHKKFYELNKEAIRKYYKEYCKLNDDKEKERHKKYRKLNKEKINKRNRNHYELNKEARLKQIKQYNQSPEGKATMARSQHTRRSKIKNTINDLTSNEWAIILQLQDYQCINCNIYFDGVMPTRDHIIPVEHGGGLTKSNVQALCHSCNSKKHTKTIDYRADNHKQIINQEIQNGS